jgi:hypothetical protein
MITIDQFRKDIRLLSRDLKIIIKETNSSTHRIFNNNYTLLQFFSDN